jgi:hypothetical protein
MPPMSLIRHAAMLAALACLAQPGAALALTAKPKPEPPRAGEAAAAKPAARPLTRAQAPTQVPTQVSIVAVTSAGAGQAGYVHYFVISGPDGEPEIQVGVELADQRIAWSFPGVGAAISPFVAEGLVTAADGNEYYVWHLYGLRPFPDDKAMAALRAALPARIKPWIAARTPHCENETRGAGCVSCLGFVLRALFPRRADGYPALPRDWPEGMAGQYTTRDLLTWLSGIAQLPTREARLKRLARQPLPADLRDDLEHLVFTMGAFDAAVAPPVPLPSKSGMRTRPARKL